MAGSRLYDYSGEERRVPSPCPSHSKMEETREDFYSHRENYNIFKTDQAEQHKSCDLQIAQHDKVLEAHASSHKRLNDTIIPGLRSNMNKVLGGLALISLMFGVLMYNNKTLAADVKDLRPTQHAVISLQVDVNALKASVGELKRLHQADLLRRESDKKELSTVLDKILKQTSN